MAADGAITVRIEDDARASQQLLSSPLSVGVHIAMNLMDSVTYKHCDKCNCLTMSKSF